MEAKNLGGRHNEQESSSNKTKDLSSKEKEEEEKPDLEHTHMENIPAGVRWVSLLGINSWFPKKWRELTPAVPIVLVGAFVTAIVQIIGNPGLFLQFT